MHKLDKEVVDAINSIDSSYAKSVEKANISVIDFNKILKLIRQCRFDAGKGSSVFVRIVNHKRGRNFTQGVSYSHIKKNGLYVGEVERINSDGSVKFRKYMIEPDEELNLSSDADAKKYLVFMLSGLFQNNPYNSIQLMGVTPIYYIEDPTEVAESINHNSDMLIKAVSRINSMPMADILSACRYFNLLGQSEAITSSIIRAKLLQHATKDPITFLSKMASRDRLLMTSIETAMILNLFEMIDDEYSYNGLRLGRTIPEIFTTLQANPEKVRYINEDINTRDTDMRAMKEQDEKKADANARISAKDVSNEMDSFLGDGAEVGSELTAEQQFAIDQERQRQQLLDDANNAKVPEDRVTGGSGEPLDFDEDE